MWCFGIEVSGGIKRVCSHGGYFAALWTARAMLAQEGMVQAMFRKKYYSMDNNGVGVQRERSMAATEVAAGLLVLRCECWVQAGWLSVHLARS